MWKALVSDGYNNITDIATLQDDEIEELKYSETEGEATVLKPVVKNQHKLLLHLLKWCDWKSKQLNLFGKEYQLELTSIEFQNFCQNEYI